MNELSTETSDGKLYFIEIKLGHKFQDLPEIEFLHAMVKDKKIKDKVSNYTTIP